MRIKIFFYFLFLNFFIKKFSKRIAKSLLLQKKKVFLIESVTCGNIANELGKINNASKFFLGSYVIYGKNLKILSFNILNNYLSFNYCQESIKITKEKINSDFFLSVSGNAGKNIWEKKPKGSFFLVIYSNKKNKYFFFKKNWNLFFLSRQKCQKLITFFCIYYLFLIIKKDA